MTNKAMTTNLKTLTAALLNKSDVEENKSLHEHNIEDEARNKILGHALVIVYKVLKYHGNKHDREPRRIPVNES